MFWWNRPDGDLVKDLPFNRRVMPYIMKGRNESAFGRVGNTSSAGAQGPMQFRPATWKA